MLSRRRVIAAKIESVEGTAEAITVTDAGILAIDPKFDADIKMNDRTNVQLNTLSKLVPILGTQAGKISFKAELKGSGAAYSATVKPGVGVFLKACGFAETIDVTAGAEKATYLPASTGVPTLSIWLYEDGAVRKLKGCRGTVKFSGKVGEPVFAEFDFTGVYDGAATLAMIAPTFESQVPPVMLNSAMTIDAYAAIIESFSVDMGNKVDLRPSINTASGYLSALLTDRNPTGKIDPEMVLAATYDFYTKWTGGAVAALNIGPISNGNYNKFAITAPKCVYTKISEGDRVGNIIADLDFALAMNTGDDEFQLQFSK